MKIGIIVAMDKELHQLQQLFSNSDVLVQKCGIGKVNAALGAQRMINEFHPDCIISSGCAGGNGDDINIQDVVVATETCYHDVYCGKAIDDTTIYGQVQGLPARFPSDPYLLRRSMELKVEGLELSKSDSAFAVAGALRRWSNISFSMLCKVPVLDSDFESRATPKRLLI